MKLALNSIFTLSQVEFQVLVIFFYSFSTKTGHFGKSSKGPKLAKSFEGEIVEIEDKRQENKEQDIFQG